MTAVADGIADGQNKASTRDFARNGGGAQPEPPAAEEETVPEGDYEQVSQAEEPVAEPVGAGVEARREEDNLADARSRRRGEEVVEEVRTDGLVAAHVRDDCGDFGIRFADLRDELVVEHGQ